MNVMMAYIESGFKNSRPSMTFYFQENKKDAAGNKSNIWLTIYIDQQIFQAKT